MPPSPDQRLRPRANLHSTVQPAPTSGWERAGSISGGVAALEGCRPEVVSLFGCPRRHAHMPDIVGGSRKLRVRRVPACRTRTFWPQRRRSVGLLSGVVRFRQDAQRFLDTTFIAVRSSLGARSKWGYRPRGLVSASRDGSGRGPRVLGGSPMLGTTGFLLTGTLRGLLTVTGAGLMLSLRAQSSEMSRFCSKPIVSSER